jgi:hypothetical protein
VKSNQFTSLSRCEKKNIALLLARDFNETNHHDQFLLKFYKAKAINCCNKQLNQDKFFTVKLAVLGSNNIQFLNQLETRLIYV